jgi:FkbM family methyltransferase
MEVTFRRAIRPLLREPHFRRFAEWGERSRRHAFERVGSDRFSWPALHGMDRRLAELLPERAGVFVEAGAHDGFDQSNTYWLERFRGWTGVLIEPVPHLYERARRERRGSQVFNCALVPADHADREVALRYGSLMTVVEGAQGSAERDARHVADGLALGWEQTYRFAVPARTLSDVLDEARVGEVDLLSLDVEGYEAPALRGLDLDRHAPRYILVEVMVDPERRKAAVEEVLDVRYQEASRLSPHDVLYERRR